MRETSDLYYRLSSPQNPKTTLFSSISDSEYEDAVETYKRKLEQVNTELESRERQYMSSRRLISIIWEIGEREFDGSMENVLNQLAERIEPSIEI